MLSARSAARCSFLLLVVYASSALAQATSSITVALDDQGVLTVRGDKEDSQVVILARDGTTLVVGGFLTEINGGNQVSYATEDIACIDVTLGGGNDELIFGCQDILLADLRIDTGRGNDSVRLLGDLRDTATREDLAAVYGHLSVNSGADADFIFFGGLTVLGQTALSTGHGDDRIGIQGEFIRNIAQGERIRVPCEFAGGLAINTGMGADDVRFDVDDVLADSTAALIGGCLIIDCGQGDDLVQIMPGSEVSIDGKADLHGGQGIDRLLGQTRLLPPEAVSQSAFEVVQ